MYMYTRRVYKPNDMYLGGASLGFEVAGDITVCNMTREHQ